MKNKYTNEKSKTKEISIMLLAAAIFVINLILNIKVGAGYRSTSYYVVNSISGSAMLYLLYQSWKIRRVSSVKSIVLGAAAIIVSGIFVWSLDELTDNLLVLILFIFTILLSCCLSWWMKKKNGGKERDFLWEIWMGMLVILYFMIISVRSYDIYRLSQAVWGKAITGCLPLICFGLFRVLKERFYDRGKIDILKLSAGYFTLAFAIYYAGAYRTFSYRWIGTSPETGIYYIIITMLIYCGEMRKLGKDKKGVLIPSVVSGTFYLLGSVLLSFFTSYRIRAVFYNLGGPAVNIVEEERVDWLAYRLATWKSFWAGNGEAIEKLPFLRKWEGYFEGYRDEGTARLGYQLYHGGWPWMLVFMALTAAICILLWRWYVNNKNTEYRCLAQYLTVSYFIRAVLVMGLYMFMFCSALEFPFSVYSGIDFMILFLYMQNADKMKR